MAISNSEKGTIYQKLSQKLDIECRLYENYAKVIIEEQQTVAKLSLARMKELTLKREALLTEMSDLQGSRQELVVALGEHPQSRLSEVIIKHFQKDAAFLLLRKVEALKKLVKKSQGLSGELNQIVSFSQRLVNGCMAIFASASNNVFRSYSPFGKIREAYHPSIAAKGTRRV